MALLLENVRCVDPSVGLDMVTNIAIRDGNIVEISPEAEIAKGERRDLTGICRVCHAQYSACLRHRLTRKLCA